MATTLGILSTPGFFGAVLLPDQRGRWQTGPSLEAVSRQSLPTDPIGTATVTFDGVNAGSEIRVYLSDGTEVAGIESGSVGQTLTWPAYAPGSPNNTVRVLVVHPQYEIKEFFYTTTPGPTTLPVQQERDPWYSNPP